MWATHINQIRRCDILFYKLTLLYGLTRNLDVTTAWPHALYVVTYYFIYTEKSRTGKYVLFVLFALVHQSASDSSGFSPSLSPLSFGRATASPSRMTG